MGAQSTDLDLLARWAQQGDAEAFNQIAVRHAGMVYSVCRRILRDATEAEDVAQECFEKLVQSSEAPREQLGGWLHSVAVSKSLNRLRARQRRVERETRYAAETEQADAKWDDLYAHVDEALAALPEAMRTPIVLHFFEGRTHDAIALELGLTRSGVTRRIERGVERLRKTLRGKGVVVTSAAALTAGLKGMAVAEAAPAGVLAATARLALAGPAAPVGVTSALGMAGALSMLQKSVIALIAFAVVGCTIWLVSRSGAFNRTDVPRTPVAPDALFRQPVSTAAAKSAHATREEKISDATRTASPLPGALLTKAMPSTSSEFGVGIPISGTVVGIDNTPIAGVKVSATTAEPREGKAATTGEDGAFQIWGVTSQSAALQLKAYKWEFASAAYGPVALPNNGVTGIVLVLHRESVISGSVRDPRGGRPNEDPKLWVIATAVADDGESGRGLTFPGGDFTLGQLHAGTYRVRAGALLSSNAGVDVFSGTDDDAVTVTVGEAEHVKDVRLVCRGQGEAPPGLSISGRVTDRNGKLLDRAHVVVSRDDHTVATLDCDNEGRFRLGALVEETYSVRAERLGYGSVEAREVAAGSSPVEIRLEEPARIRGRVVRADTGEPISEFDVGVAAAHMDAPVAYLNRWKTLQSTYPYGVRNVSNANGTFVLKDLSSGGATVYALAKGFALGSSTVSNVLPGSTYEGVVIALKREALVQGVARDGDGKPVARAKIFVSEIPDGADRVSDTCATTDANGAFAVHGLPEGTCVVGAYHPEYAPATATVDARADGGARVEISFVTGGAVEGAVRFAGESANAQTVQAHYPGGRGIGSAFARTNNEGRFRFDHLAPGEVELWASRPRTEEGAVGPERVVKKAVSVQDGVTSTVNFDLPAE